MSTITILGSFILGSIIGIKYQMWLDTNQPTKQQIKKLNNRFMILGVVSFIGMFLPYVYPMCSSLFGIGFALIYLNKKYEKSLP